MTPRTAFFIFLAILVPRIGCGEDGKTFHGWNAPEPECISALSVDAGCGLFGVYCPYIPPAVPKLKAPRKLQDQQTQEEPKACPDINAGFQDLGTPDDKKWWSVEGPNSEYTGRYRVLKNEGEKSGNAVSVDLDTPCLKVRLTLARAWNSQAKACQDTVALQKLKIENEAVKADGESKGNSAKVTYNAKKDEGMISYSITDKKNQKENYDEDFWDGNNADADNKKKEPVQMTIEMGGGWDFVFQQKSKPEIEGSEKENDK